MKKISAFLLCAILLFTLVPVAAADDTQQVSVVVNGEKMEFDQPPIIIDGRIMVPMRAIFEKLGAIVDWEAKTQTITATRKNVTIIMQIGKPEAKIDGNPYLLDVPAQIVGSRTLVPIRFVSECFGAHVLWDAKNYTGIIELKDPVNPGDNNKPIEPKELTLTTSLSKSIISFGDSKKISFSLTAEGNGGTGEYEYRFQLLHNGSIEKETDYSNKNTLSGELQGAGEYSVRVYVRDGENTIHSEYSLTD